MSMTIQSSVKDKIWLLQVRRPSKYEYEIRYHPGKANVVINALRRKERVKPRRVRAMAMTIQYGVTGMILVAQSEVFKQENGMMRTVVIDKAHASRYLIQPGADKSYYNLGDILLAYCNSLRYLSKNEIESPWILSVNFQDNNKEWNSGDDQLRFRWMIYLVVLADAAESVSDAIRFDYQLSIQCAPFEALYGRKCRSPVLWAEIGESSLIGLELVQETTDKVVLIKEKLKAVRNHQKSYVDYRRKPLEFEVGDQVILRVSPWKGVMRFGKKGMLAPRYVGPFEILERNWPCSLRLRLPKELNSVHDTLYVSNLKKCPADANLHVPLNEIKVNKTLCSAEEPVEIMEREIRKLKRRKVRLMKVRWNSKRGPKFTWEREVYMKSNCVLRLEAAFEHSGGSPAGIHGLFSGWYCGLAGRKVTLRVSMAWAKRVTTGTLVRYETSCSRFPVMCVIDWICMLAGNHFEDDEVRKSG
ncbi:hypothetical protein Tco_1169249 [Tanacetum coccineum]